MVFNTDKFSQTFNIIYEFGKWDFLFFSTWISILLNKTFSILCGQI